MEFSGNSYYSGGAREGGYERGACGNGMDCAVVVGRDMFWDNRKDNLIS
jgi:hypothetical protein